ncbi:S-adenosyl-L-methionine-dependent methyltransferase [Haematococcus lacustris]
MKLLHRDRLFNEWRVRQVKVLARYMVFEGVRHLAITCGEPEAPLTLEELGNKQCYADIEPVEFASQFGYMPRPWTSPMHLARDALTRPVCTMLTWNHSTSWADWLQRERVGNPEWKTFHTKSYAEDTLILLFDLLYESRRTYTQQHWLGTIAMQNPFDMYSIQDIIFTVRPDIIIETGTANGGSALLWASIMELCDIQGGRVVTVDVNPPDWSVGRRSWGGIPRSNPVEHRLWKKRVTFIKGLSTAPEVVQQVVGLVANHTQVPGTGQAPGPGPGLHSKQAAAKVLVLLDSSHREEAVREEMDHYCQLVTAGSYCIVEDVKLSRWSSNGPLAAIRAFLAAHPDFRSDRQRELLYTHHASGYLLRAAP